LGALLHSGIVDEIGGDDFAACLFDHCDDLAAVVGGVVDDVEEDFVFDIILIFAASVAPE